MSQTGIMPLAMLRPGQKARVVYTEEYGRGLVQHLSDMGLSEGSEIEVITPGSPGPYLVAIKETRLMIGQGIANKVLVDKNI